MLRLAIEIFQTLHLGVGAHNELRCLVVRRGCTVLRIAHNAPHSHRRANSRVVCARFSRYLVSFAWISLWLPFIPRMVPVSFALVIIYLLPRTHVLLLVRRIVASKQAEVTLMLTDISRGLC